MAKGDLKGKTLPNKKLKGFMLRAKNGAMYRTCATPEKKKAPKKQVRGAPRPANQRQDKYLVAYQNGRPKPAKKATKPATKAPAKPKQARMPVKQAERAKELMNKAKKKIAENKAKATPIKKEARAKELINKFKIAKAKKAVAKAGGKVSKSMPKKTHSMPDGTKMTGATHSADSKPVIKAPAKLKRPPVKNPSKKITKADRKKYEEQLRAEMKSVKNKEDYEMLKKKYDEIDKATTKAQVAMIKTKYAKN